MTKRVRVPRLRYGSSFSANLTAYGVKTGETLTVSHTRGAEVVLTVPLGVGMASKGRMVPPFRCVVLTRAQIRELRTGR